MGWISKLFGIKKSQTQAQSAPKEKQEVKKPVSPYLTQTVVFGMHQYRRAGDDSSVYFVDEPRGIRKMIVDSVGRIQNFPGIRDQALIEEIVSEEPLKPQIRFRTSFEKREDQWIMLWQIQPDGRYWEDEDGFGGTNDEEVTLCTYMDSNGEFTGPFELYERGIRKIHTIPRRCYPVKSAKQLPEHFYSHLDKWKKELIRILESGEATWYAKSVSTTFVFWGVHYQLVLNDFCSQDLMEQYPYGICAAAFEILQKTVKTDLENMGAEDVENFGFLD